MLNESNLCPNCNAEITADDTQLFVYCRYCGVKIQTREVVEIRHVNVTESLEKMVRDGDTYQKVEEYYLAERKFREVIKQYPQQRAGYEGLIRTLTQNEKVFPLSHETEVLRLLYEAEQLASPEEKEVFDARRKRMLEGFDAERAKVAQALRDREIEMERNGKIERIIFSVSIFTAAFIVALMTVMVDCCPPIEFTAILVAFVGVSFWLIWRKK